DDAWQDLLACHRFGRLIARGGTLFEALVGIALDNITSNADLAYLQSASLTVRQIQERRKDLQGLPPVPPMADKVDLGARLVYLDALQLIRRDCISSLAKLAGGPQKKPDAERLKALGRIDWETALRNGNRWYDRLAAAMRLKDRAERIKAFDKI